MNIHEVGRNHLRVIGIGGGVLTEKRMKRIKRLGVRVTVCVYSAWSQ